MSELKTNKIATNDANNVAMDNSLNLKSYTTTQRDALSSPVAGDMIYNSDNGAIDFYNGTQWIAGDNTFTFDKEYKYVFCYGYQVEDFNILNKNKLFTLNFSATQELDRKLEIESQRLSKLNDEKTQQIDELTTENNLLKSQVETLMASNQSILERLIALEQKQS